MGMAECGLKKLRTRRSALPWKVGAAGFEPTTTRTPSECATSLRHAPKRSAASTHDAVVLVPRCTLKNNQEIGRVSRPGEGTPDADCRSGLPPFQVGGTFSGCRFCSATTPGKGTTHLEGRQ